MGCSFSKSWKASAEDTVGAYKWDERECCCCGSNKFKLVKEPDDHSNTEFQAVKDIVEPNLCDAADLIMEYTTRGCCCCDSLDFDRAIHAINNEWVLGINNKLKSQSLGYVVDAFTWEEWQCNGQSLRETSFLVLRIKEVGVKESFNDEE